MGAQGGAASGAGGGGASSGRGGASGNPGMAGAAGVYTQCPSSQGAQGAPCEGDFVCSYELGCSACACCSSALFCKDGVLQFGGSNDGCVQTCPQGVGGAGGLGGSGGGAGVGAAGATSEAGAGGDARIVDLTECGAPTPCDPAVTKVGELTEQPSWFALHCIIAAFAARTPGVYLAQTTIVGLDGEGTTTIAYLIKADGTVNRITKSGDTVSSPQICAAQPEGAYAPCLEGSGADSPLACQDTAWVTDCEPGTVSCE